MHSPLGRNLLPVLTLLLAFSPVSALAQSADLAVRRELLERAQLASVEGRHAEALEIAERAGRIEMSASLLSFLAQEHLAVGHYAAALDRAEQCVREARANPGTPQRDAILSACQTVSRSATSRVGHVVVHVPSPPPAGLHVTVAGADLHEALFGVPYIVDPGDVVVRATSASGATFQQTLAVVTGQEVSVTVTLAADVQPVTAAPVQADTALAPTRSAAHDHASASRGFPVVPTVVTAAGVIAVGFAGFVYWGPRQGDANTLSMQCMAGACPVGAQPTYRQLMSDTTTTNILLIAGTVVAVAGATWLVIDLASGRHEERHPAVSAMAMPMDHGGMIAVGGAL